MLLAPKGPFFTGSWSKLRSSTRHTCSNQQAQRKKLRLLILQKMDEDTVSMLLAVALNMYLTQTYCYFDNENNQ